MADNRNFPEAQPAHGKRAGQTAPRTASSSSAQQSQAQAARTAMASAIPPIQQAPAAQPGRPRNANPTNRQPSADPFAPSTPAGANGGWSVDVPPMDSISYQGGGAMANQVSFNMPPKKKGGTVYRIIMVLAAIVFLTCTVLLAMQLVPYLKESKASDAVRSEFIVKEADANAADGSEDQFPVIDWDALQKVNPDVIGWIQVPDTNIDYAICADKPDSPDFYLHHDLYGESSVYGVPYLDATCNTDWTSPNSLVFGHHLFSQDMFTAFSDFEDASYFKKHRTILLMTPEKNMKLNAVMVNVVDGYTEQRTTEFENKKEFLSYWNEQREASEVVAKDVPDKPSQVFCFVTCESDSTSDKRVMVYAINTSADDDQASEDAEKESSSKKKKGSSKEESE